MTITSMIISGTFTLTFEFRMSTQHALYIHSFYNLFSMQTYKGEPSKWMYNNLPDCDTMLEILGLDDAIVKSYNNLCPEDALVSTSKFLPQASVGTSGLLAILGRWACFKQRDGGSQTMTR